MARYEFVRFSAPGVFDLDSLVGAVDRAARDAASGDAYPVAIVDDDGTATTGHALRDAILQYERGTARQALRWSWAALALAALAGVASVARSPQNAAAAVGAWVGWLGVRWAAPSAWKLCINRTARVDFRMIYRVCRDAGGGVTWSRWRVVAGVFYAFREARHAR